MIGLELVFLRLTWVAAYHGLRSHGAAMRRLYGDGAVVWRHDLAWNHVHDITRALGYPPAPGPHEARRE